MLVVCFINPTTCGCLVLDSVCSTNSHIAVFQLNLHISDHLAVIMDISITISNQPDINL